MCVCHAYNYIHLLIYMLLAIYIYIHYYIYGTPLMFRLLENYLGEKYSIYEDYIVIIMRECKFLVLINMLRLINNTSVLILKLKKYLSSDCQVHNFYLFYQRLFLLTALEYMNKIP